MTHTENKELHRNGPCKVQYGSIYGFNGCMIENPAVILDITKDPDDILTLHRYGSADAIKSTYDNMHDRYIRAGFTEMAENLVMITFDTITGFADYDRMTGAKFTTDEICTLINWLGNAISVKSFNELFVSEETAHAELAKLMSFGF